MHTWLLMPDSVANARNKCQCDPSRIVEPYQAEIDKLTAERDLANDKATELEKIRDNLVKEKVEAMSSISVYNNMRSCIKCQHWQEELNSLKQERNSLLETLSTLPDRHELTKAKELYRTDVNNLERKLSEREDEMKKLRSELESKSEKLKSRDREVEEEGERLHKTLRDKINELESVKNMLLRENSPEKYEKTIAEKQHEVKVLRKKLHLMNSKLQSYTELKSQSAENSAINEKLKKDLQARDEELNRLQKCLSGSDEKSSQHLEKMEKQRQRISDLEMIVETDNATISTLRENIGSKLARHDSQSGSDDEGMEQHMEQLKSLITEKDEQISDLTRRYERKSEQLNSSLAKQEQVLHEKSSLKKKLHFAHDHVKTKEGVIRELEETITAHEVNITQLEESVSSSKKQTESVSKEQMEKLMGDNVSLQRNLKELNQKIQRLEKDRDSVRKENGNLKEEQEQKVKKIESLESQLKMTSQHVDTWKKASTSYDELRKESLKFLNEMSKTNRESLKRRNSISGPAQGAAQRPDRAGKPNSAEAPASESKLNTSVDDIDVGTSHCKEVDSSETLLPPARHTTNSEHPAVEQGLNQTTTTAEVDGIPHHHGDEPTSSSSSLSPPAADPPTLKKQSFSSPAGLNNLSPAPLLGGGRSNTPMPVSSPLAKKVQNLVVNSPPPPRLHPSQRPSLHKHRSCPEGLMPNLGDPKTDSNLEEFFNTISEDQEYNMFSFDDTTPSEGVPTESGSAQTDRGEKKPKFLLGSAPKRRSRHSKHNVEFDLDEDVMFEFAESECEREASNETNPPSAPPGGQGGAERDTPSYRGTREPVTVPLSTNTTDTPSSSKNQTFDKAGKMMSVVSPFTMQPSEDSSGAAKDDGLTQTTSHKAVAATRTPLSHTSRVVTPVTPVTSQNTTPPTVRVRASERGHVSIPSPSRSRSVFDDNSGKIVSISGVQPKRSPVNGGPSPVVDPSLGNRVYQKVATFADAAVNQAHKALSHIRGEGTSDITTPSAHTPTRSLSLNMSAQLRSSASHFPLPQNPRIGEKWSPKSVSNSQSASSANSQSEDADSISSDRLDGETLNHSFHRSSSESAIARPTTPSRIPRFQSPVRQPSPARNPGNRHRTHSAIPRQNSDDSNSGTGASSSSRSGSGERRSRPRTTDRPSSCLGSERQSRPQHNSRRNSVSSKTSDSLTYI